MAYIWWGSIPLQIRLDRTILLVELCHIRHEILNNIGMWQRINPALLRSIGRDTAQAGKRVDTIDVHSAGAADTLSARPSEGQRWVHLILDPD